MMDGIKPGDSTPLSVFKRQELYQHMITGLHLPEDNVNWFQYHIAALVEETGELLKSDKRWKTHRNTSYNPDNKLEELADLYITVLNLTIFSGFNREQLKEAVNKKISENIVKWEEANK